MARATMRFTTRDLELMPDDGKRYEIIDGELYVSKQPGAEHQAVCGNAVTALSTWSFATGAGEVLFAPGVIFSEDNNVVPDVAWVSRERRRGAYDEKGHYRVAPDLVLEALSPGAHKEGRDRDVKLKLYSSRGVREYWIADWRGRQVEVYRRRDLELHYVGTLHEGDTIESPLLPGFRLPVADLFRRAVPTDD